MYDIEKSMEEGVFVVFEVFLKVYLLKIGIFFFKLVKMCEILKMSVIYL